MEDSEAACKIKMVFLLFQRVKKKYTQNFHFRIVLRLPTATKVETQSFNENKTS